MELTSDQIARIRNYLMRAHSCVRWVTNTTEDGREVTWTSDDLLDTLDAKEERVREIEASCAVMRQALDQCYWSIIGALPAHQRKLDVNGQVQDPLGMNQAYETAHQAFATDAGKAMLERMAKQQKALKAWRAWCMDERHSVADDTQLFETAIELMDDAIAIKEAQDV